MGRYSIRWWAFALGVYVLAYAASKATGLTGPGWISDAAILPVAVACAGLSIRASREALGARASIADRERGLEAIVATRTAELSAAEAHFRALIQHSSDVTTFVDRDLIVRWQSESAQRVLGWAPDRHVARCILDVLPGGHRHPICAAMRGASGQRGTPVMVEVDFDMRDGVTRHTETAVTRLPAEAPRQGWILNTRDVTPQHELQAALTHQAFHDPLTGLANRSLFADRLEHALNRAGRTASPLAVLAVDLDDFKAVNDSLGHAAGDDLLREVATRLLSAVRLGDTVARLGGDEFAVLLDPADEQVSGEVSERILASLREPCRIDAAELAVEASIGIASTEHHAATVDELLRNADLALYEAKASGKRTISRYHADLHDAAARRLALHSGLRHALEREELSLQYQPIVELGEGTLIGAEALLRWTHGQMGFVSPVEFVPIAEDTGLIVEIGRWVLEQACAEACRWPVPVGISVNLSGRQLATPGIVDDVRRVLADTSLDPARLTLEITESVLVDDLEATAARLTSLKTLGVRVAIDDFGTGYSSLSALSHFPADVLKIDRSFVSGICTDHRHHDLATTIVRLGEALGMTTLAEGIETREQQAALGRLGCEVGQGYLFSRPVPPHELAELLAARAAQLAS